MTPSSDAVVPAELSAHVVALGRALRDEGVPVTPAASVEGARALAALDLGDRDEVREGLRCAMLSRPEDFAAFDAAFDRLWRLPAPAGGAALPGPRRDLAPPTPPAPRRAPPVTLRSWMKPGGTADDDGSPVSMRAASDLEGRGPHDATALAADDDAALAALARRLVRRMARRNARRWKPAARGARIDLRRTMRAALRTGGEPVRLARRERKRRRTSLVVLCDVSGSMALYARLLLQFVHALQNTYARVETFAFATRLSRLTPLLRGVRYREALRDLGRDVQDLAGGTRIGASLERFAADYPRLVDRRTLVLILSDGWDVGDPARLADAMRLLARRSGRIVWLNPLMGAADYAPDTRGMQAALPFLDLLAPGHNLDALRALERHLTL